MSTRVPSDWRRRQGGKKLSFLSPRRVEPLTRGDSARHGPFASRQWRRGALRGGSFLAAGLRSAATGEARWRPLLASPRHGGCAADALVPHAARSPTPGLVRRRLQQRGVHARDNACLSVRRPIRHPLGPRASSPCSPPSRAPVWGAGRAVAGAVFRWLGHAGGGMAAQESNPFQNPRDKTVPTLDGKWMPSRRAAVHATRGCAGQWRSREPPPRL